MATSTAADAAQPVARRGFGQIRFAGLLERRRLVGGILLGVLGGVAALGMARPSGAATSGAFLAGSSASPAVPAAVSSSNPVASLLGGGSAAAAINVPDLIFKGILVLGLLLVTLRVLRHVQRGSNGHGGRLVVLESRTLAAKASLHLVAVGERRLIVGLTPAGMVSLGELDAAELPDESAERSTDGLDGSEDGPRWLAVLDRARAAVSGLRP